MRVNLPVLPDEYHFPADVTLVSKTDLKGRILYANPAFIKVSGFSREELLGQPHNLVRHPDMPEEAFRDMWETISAGQPWSAPVKNRRKDGRYYWVIANVTPLVENGRPIGYMSVRTWASPEQIAQAEALYATMRREETQGKLVHRLQAGEPLPTGWRGVLAAIGRRSPVSRLQVLCGSACLASCALGAWATPATGGAALPVLAALAGSVAVGLAAAARLNSTLIHPFQEMITAANRMAAGDLTQQIPVRRGLAGRFARALRQLNVNLAAIVSDVRQNVERVRVAANEIATGSSELSVRTEAQAGSVEKTAASMEEITGTVRQTSDRARQAASLVREAQDATERSSEEMVRLEATMHAISQSSLRIGQIIEDIDGISFQTNLLALNAAVEAARAGEQGRGFAVVAGEVRALAQRTLNAASEIKRLAEESGARVAEGEQQVAATASTMQQAVERVGEANSLIGEISIAATEQLQGISQVNEAVNHLDGITQHNAAMVEQLAASATGLHGQAEALTESVSVFRLDKARLTQPDAVQLRKQMKQAATASAAA
ncbi:methyl-accepting chemotaxis protein [Caldimonas thermodepolymerans]|jgi:PAS domain S-box|uniref:methyl-accepting chemotaxis protein n=1 Tax=Caldimonas thermodepolymerans TaxID=215580 RepID=UPI0024936CF5|nr:PAS domain-containing methyl-accepting chemotaxis protein [Caldimonas thermodepolymerans]